MREPRTPLLSFIVPAHNEEALIEVCLRSIHQAAVAVQAPYEVLVVNDASTDRTRERAAELEARIIDVSLRKISSVRNAGARASRGDWLFFVDADTRVTPQVIRAAVRALRAGQVGGGARVAFDGRIPPWARLFWELFATLYHAAGLAAGCFVYCRRTAFDQAGGFDESQYAAEEVTLSRALARRGRFRILRQRVITSGRKLRTYSAGELLGAMWKLGLGGKAAVRDGARPELGIWYAPRREDRG